MIFTPIQWLQVVIKNCMQLISAGNVTEGETKKLRDIYCDFSDKEKDEIHQLIARQFEVEDSVLILSYIIRILQLEDFEIDVSEKICVGNYNFATRIMLEMQLDKISYEKKRILHKKNVDLLLEEVASSFTYIPVNSRNSGRVVIITEQLLENLYHAPTRMVLQTAYILQKHFELEVKIYTCASNEKLPLYTWINAKFYNSAERGYLQRYYKDSVFEVYQYPLSDCGIKDYQQMFSEIYKFNPLFVFEMGVFNPVADVLHEFTTVVNLNMVTDAPVSEADIFIRTVKLAEDIENIYKKNLTLNQKQIFMSQKFPALFETDGTMYTRQELRLPEDKFLIAIVGNRLDQEIKDTFEKFMFEILQQNKKIDFVIIGEVERLQSRLVDKVYNKRVHYMGYCTDLKGVVGALDLYLNPDRLGGGWSSAIALYAGIPVVTFEKGDVAYNVSEKFVVRDYKEMYEVIQRYMENEEFYKAQSQEASRYAKEHGESKVIDFYNEMFVRIKEIMIKG